MTKQTPEINTITTTSLKQFLARVMTDHVAGDMDTRNASALYSAIGRGTSILKLELDRDKFTHQSTGRKPRRK